MGSRSHHHTARGAAETGCCLARGPYLMMLSFTIFLTSLSLTHISGSGVTWLRCHEAGPCSASMPLTSSNQRPGGVLVANEKMGQFPCPKLHLNFTNYEYENLNSCQGRHSSKDVFCTFNRSVGGIFFSLHTSLHDKTLSSTVQSRHIFFSVNCLESNALFL